MTGWPVLEIELLWIVSPFNQDLANTCQIHQIHQSLVITNFNRMNASGNQGCIALPFVISRMSLLYGCVLILALHPSWSHPHRTPSLGPFISDVVILQIQFRQGGVLLQGLGQSLTGDTWLKKRDEAQGKNHTAKLRKVPTLIVLLLSKITVLGSKTKWNNQSPWLIIDTMPCQSVVDFA